MIHKYTYTWLAHALWRSMKVTKTPVIDYVFCDNKIITLVELSNYLRTKQSDFEVSTASMLRRLQIENALLLGKFPSVALGYIK